MSTSSEGNVISVKEVDIFPASFAQQRLWLLAWLELQSTAYLITSVVRVNLPLNLEVLKQSQLHLSSTTNSWHTILVATWSEARICWLRRGFGQFFQLLNVHFSGLGIMTSTRKNGGNRVLPLLQ